MLGVAGIVASKTGSLLAHPNTTNNPTADHNGEYTLPPLPYGYDALEPYIDKETMEIHHTKHHAAYVSNLNKGLAATTGKAELEAINKLGLESILANISKYPMPVRNNAGGHYNHSLFWTLMKPVNKDSSASNAPSGNIAEAINTAFGNFEDFKKKFTEAATTRFGSGWAWLYVNAERKLAIGSTPNQDNPLMDMADIKGTPVLALDVWEHAYYLHYQNKRADYINNWWHTVNWEKANALFIAHK